MRNKKNEKQGRNIILENQITILIIDDDEAIRQSYADYLEDFNYQVLTAENGRTGLGIFQHGKVDLVLLDLRMPEMNGLEVLAKITEKSSDIPLIVVSGTGDISDAVEALHQGAWDYLLKPIEDLSVLIHAIENALEKARLKRENSEYQQHLEQMVDKRTEELQQANNNLSLINSRLRGIVRITQSLSFCKKVDQFGSLLLEKLGEHMKANGGSLYLRGEKGMHLIHTLDPGHAPQFIPFPLAEGSIFQRIFSQKQPLLIDNISNCTDLAVSGWKGYKNESVLVFPLPDESGEITGILTLHSKKPPPFIEQDKKIGTIMISYSSEALRALRAMENLYETEEQFRTILDNTGTGIIIVEIETMKLVYVNPTAAEIIGSPARDITGCICYDILCPDNREHCPVFDSNYHSGLKIDPSECMITNKNGKQIPVLKTITRTLHHGRECLLESFTDLTPQKRVEEEKLELEAQLRQAQKMESLGTLAGGIAHDFNNILSAVTGYAELGLRELNDKSDPLHKKLKSILDAGHRARDLIKQIMTFSSMKEQIHIPIMVSPIVEEAVQLLKASLPADIQIKTNIISEQTILADPTQIHQIVMNLCTNAYHSMEDKGGVLSISLELISFDLLESKPQSDLLPGHYLKLTIADTGGGIKPSIRSRIFDPYFTTKDKNKGTGLGLALVHGIVKSHEGAISVSSKLNKGTSFDVFLPVSTNMGNPENESMCILPRGSENILFVDDEKMIVDIGFDMLEDLGYHVTGVTSSLKALELFQQSPRQFDLVITDLSMPELTGDRLAKELIAIRPDIPVIMCTGFPERLDENLAHSIGIKKLLMKPFAMNILAKAVSEVLDGEERILLI